MMIGKKKSAQNPSAAKNRQSVENSRKIASQSGLARVDNSAVSSNSAKKPPVKSPQNPQSLSKNSPNHVSGNSAKGLQNGSVNGKSGVKLDKSAPNRDIRSSAKPAQNGSVNGKSGAVRKLKKTAPPSVNRQPPRSPAKPVNEQARKAADRAAQAKTRAGVPEKKRPYRGGNYTLYFVLAAIVVGIVMAILSNTVLFKCGAIEVTGTTRYTSEEIIFAAGVKTGENLLHIDAKKAEQSVMNAFAFVDKVSVKKNFPTKIVIEITEAQNWFALNQGGKTVVISRGGRVLGTIPADGLVVVKGFEAESLDTGSQLNSKVDAKNKIVMEIFETAEKVGLSNVTEIDLTDRFSIKITVDNRIVLNLGSSVQLESKLRVGQALIEKEIAEDERVSVLLTNPEKVAVESLSHGQKPVQSSAEKPVQSSVESSAQTESAPDNGQNSSAEQPVSQSSTSE